MCARSVTRASAGWQPRLMLALAIAACLSGGCSRASTSSPNPAPSASPASASATASAHAATNLALEGEARSLLDAWLAAQNSGDFGAYEQLYAPRFGGIRRSGAQTVTLDRARWMKERERMFHEKTTVTAKDVVIRPVPDGAEIELMQTWANPAYRDEGPKRIVALREPTAGKKLRITREEMLASSTVSQRIAPLDEKLVFALNLPTPHLVIAVNADASWAAGEPRLVPSGRDKETFIARREAGPRVPTEALAWSGRRVELFGAAGAVCEGAVDGFAVIGRASPAYSTQASWRGLDPTYPKPPDAEIAGLTWEMSSNYGRLLVASVRPDDGDCSGALWGRATRGATAAADAGDDAGKPPSPAFVAGIPADAATRALASRELRKTKAFQETQARYVARRDGTEPPRFDDVVPQLDVRVFAHPTLGTIVSLMLVTNGRSCSTFSAVMSAIWEKKATGELVLLRDASADEIAPVSAGDVDGDGRLDLLDVESVLFSHGGKLRAGPRLSVPDFRCPC